MDGDSSKVLFLETFHFCNIFDDCDMCLRFQSEHDSRSGRETEGSATFDVTQSSCECCGEERRPLLDWSRSTSNTKTRESSVRKRTFQSASFFLVREIHRTKLLGLSEVLQNQLARSHLE